MRICMIATWKMAYDGVVKGSKLLQEGASVSDAVVCAIEDVENNPTYRSVGYGGLPNQLGQVELDAAYMDGDSLKFGAVMAVKHVKNPIKLAERLSKLKRNNVLAGPGAEKYAEIQGYESVKMLTDESRQKWQEEIDAGFDAETLEAYEGHDTVCVIGLDSQGRMSNGVSTSGLFMKHPGRIGDSPIIGSGFYCDSQIGAASATGLGEDIMKGCLSFQIVSFIKSGMDCQTACEKALFEHVETLHARGLKPGSMSVIAMDKAGNFGGATTLEEFPFVVGQENMKPMIYVARYDGKIHTVEEATKEWLDSYQGD